MPTWAITDDTSSIAIAQNGVVIKNIDKDIVVLRIVPAGVGLNTSAIDQLYIEHDGEYSTQIPYNDVTVSGVAPSSVENFRTRVLTILNNNGGGGSGLLPTIEITVDDVQVTDPTSLAVGQTYRVTSVGSGTSLPTGIDAVILTVTTTNGTSNQWSDLAQIYLTGTEFVWGKYDASTNTIVKLLPRNTIRISRTAFNAIVTSWPTIDVQTPWGVGQTFIIDGDGVGGDLLTGYNNVLCAIETDLYFGEPKLVNCQVYINSLGQYVPCQYDVINNTVSGEYVLWAGEITQTSGVVSVNLTYINNLGETPVFSGGVDAGIIAFETTTFTFPTCYIFCQPFIAASTKMAFTSLVNDTAQSLLIYSYSEGLSDDNFAHTYIKIFAML